MLSSSCFQKQHEPTESGVISDNIDLSVSPSENLDLYVNGRWLKNTNVPEDKQFHGAVTIVSDRASFITRQIIEESSKNSPIEGSDAQKVGDFYKSFLDQETRDKKGISPLHKEFTKIENIKNNKDLSAFFGYASIYGIKVPIALTIENDFQNPKKHSLVAWFEEMGSLSKEFYLSETPEDAAMRLKYLEHITKMFDLANIPNSLIKATAVLNLEYKLAAIRQRMSDFKDATEINNKFAVKDLYKLTPNYDWNAHFNAMGVSSQDSIVIGQVNYVKGLDKLMSETPLETWKSFLKWKLISGSARLLTQEIEDENFQFFSKTYRKIQEPESKWRNAIAYINTTIGDIIGKIYAEKYFSKEAKESVYTIANNVIDTYIEQLEMSAWLSTASKKESIQKLKKLRLKLGYPDKWTDYTELVIVPDDLYGNTRRAFEFYHKITLQLLNESADKNLWLLPPQNTDIFNHPTLIELTIPAGLLQGPFFNINAENAVNYGSFGAFLAKQLAFIIDDRGSVFDANGAMKPWWNEQDKIQFKKRLAPLEHQIRQFNIKPKTENLTALGLSDIGNEISALSIAYKAYQKSLKKKESPIMDGFTGIQRFIIGWVQTNAIKISPELEKKADNDLLDLSIQVAQKKTNLIIRNFPEFYEAFNVQETDSMYLEPKNRIKLW